MIRFHRFLALATLACTAGTVGMAVLLAMHSPSAPHGRDDDRSAAATRSDAIVSAAPGRIHLPLLSKGHPLAVCRGGMDEAEAVEQARIASFMMGLHGPTGDIDSEVVAALRMTAAEHDERFPEDGSLLEDVFPAGPPWICYWRIELRGEGVLRAGPFGSGPIRINRSMELFPAETCDDCIGGMSSYWWEDEGTPGVEATGTVDVPTGTATMTGTRPPASPTATARVWPSPTP